MGSDDYLKRMVKTFVKQSPATAFLYSHFRKQLVEMSDKTLGGIVAHATSEDVANAVHPKDCNGEFYPRPEMGGRELLRRVAYNTLVRIHENLEQ